MRFVLALLFSVMATNAFSQNVCRNQTLWPQVLSGADVRQEPYAALCESTSQNSDGSVADYYLTTSFSLHNWSVASLGYTASSPAERFWVEGHLQPGTRPIYRFVSQNPLLHAYSSSPNLPTALFPYTWTAEGIDGYVLSASSPDFQTKTVRQWARYSPTIAYTLASASPGTGWSAVSIPGLSTLGYAPIAQPPLFNANVAQTWQSPGTGFRMLRRCKTADLTTCYDSDAMTSGARYYSPTKGSNTTHHTDFSFSADSAFFADGVHITSATHGDLVNGSVGVLVVIGRFNGRGNDIGRCDEGIRVALEAHWGTGNKMETLSCSPPLSPTKRYRVTSRSTDSGAFAYELFDLSSSSSVPIFTYAAPDIRGTVFQGHSYPQGKSSGWIAPVWGPNITPGGNPVLAPERTANIFGASSYWSP